MPTLRFALRGTHDLVWVVVVAALVALNVAQVVRLVEAKVALSRLGVERAAALQEQRQLLRQEQALRVQLEAVEHAQRVDDILRQRLGLIAPVQGQQRRVVEEAR